MSKIGSCFSCILLDAVDPVYTRLSANGSFFVFLSAGTFLYDLPGYWTLQTVLQTGNNMEKFWDLAGDVPPESLFVSLRDSLGDVGLFIQ